MNPEAAMKALQASSPPPTVEIMPFLAGLAATAVLCYILGLVYIRFGRSLSNRENLARTFVIIGMTTMCIITVVKSSLALSLGLVGALSIVRFRTAIKEPEELTYLFVVIALGLGFGASQWQISVAGFVLILLAIMLLNHQRKLMPKGIYMSISADRSDNVTLAELTKELTGTCAGLILKRVDEAGGSLSASYLVYVKNYDELEKARAAIRSRGDSIKISIIDNEITY